MSFFKKYTPVGSTPIAPQKRVIKHSHPSDAAPATTTPKLLSASAANSSTAKKLPRRIASSSNVPVRSSPAASTKQNGSAAGIASPLKRKLDPSKSTPNLKRPAVVEKRDSLKPPTPESVAGASSRSPRSMRLESSDEESEDERDSKRSKVGSRSPLAHDTTRKLVHPISFHNKDPKTGKPVAPCEFIHCELIANVKLKEWNRRKGTPPFCLPTPPL